MVCSPGEFYSSSVYQINSHFGQRLKILEYSFEKMINCSWMDGLNWRPVGKGHGLETNENKTTQNDLPF